MTTLLAYGFDSFPYLHVARRLKLPYAMVLAVIDDLEGKIYDTITMLPDAVAVEILRVYDEEQKRRKNEWPEL